MPGIRTVDFLNVRPRKPNLDTRSLRFEGVYRNLMQSDGRESFDLDLFALARELRVDSDELMRRMGEQWASETYREELERSEVLKALSSFLRSAFVDYAKEFCGLAGFELRETVRGQRSLSLLCSGPRKGIPFVEGIVRSFEAKIMQPIRLQRRPVSPEQAYLHLSVSNS